MADVAALWRRIVDYAHDDDPLTRASNILALVVASNQPFYPFYLRWMVGEFHWTLALTFLSTPFFLASPHVARRFPGIGRLFFPTVGAINTFFCAFVFGEASGVELFLAPCLVIAALSCRASERNALAVFLASFLAAFLLLHGNYGAPWHEYTAEQYRALLSLNAYSAAFLSVAAAWTLSGAWAES